MHIVPELIAVGTLILVAAGFVTFVLVFDPFHPGEVIKGSLNSRDRPPKPPLFPRASKYDYGAVMKAKKRWWYRTVNAYDGTPVWAALDPRNADHRKIILNAEDK